MPFFILKERRKQEN